MQSLRRFALLQTSRPGIRRLFGNPQTRLFANGNGLGGTGPIYTPPRPGRNDRAWFLGALAFTLPAGYYLYQRHTSDGQAPPPPSPAVVIPDLSGQYDGAIVLDAQSTGPGADVVVEPAVFRARYLLIGGGLASFAAMESILATDPDADILMVTDESYPPYMRPPLAKELWYNFDRNTDEAHGNTCESYDFTDWHGERKPIFFQDPQFYDDANQPSHGTGRSVRLLTGRRAKSIDPAARIVTLHDGSQVYYEKALLATGSSPKQLTGQMDPNALEHVSQLRSLADFRRIRAAVDVADHIAIIGGGFIGSELAACIASYAEIQRPERPLRITQIFPEEGNMGLVFPKYLSTWAMKQLRNLGIDIWPSSRIRMVSLLPNDRLRIQAATDTEGEKTVDVDHVVVAIGVEPNTGIAHGNSAFSLDKDGGIQVSPTLEVVPGSVFAAGDIISFRDANLDQWHRVEHYDHALNTGRIAGENMTEPDPRNYLPYDAISLFWSDLGPTIGYEAVGICDNNLTTFGVWAKAESKDTPSKVELDTTDIRTESVGQTAPGSVQPLPVNENLRQQALVKHFNDSEYRKGLVLYVKDKRIVGLLMFNLFNRTALAKSVIRQRLTVDDLQDIVELFNINDK